MTTPTLPGVPKLADVAPNIAVLRAQQLTLGQEDSALRQETLDIAEAQRQNLTAAATSPSAEEVHCARLARVLNGSPSTSAPEPNRLAEIAARRREIAGLLEEVRAAIEHEIRAGSRVIVAQVAALQRERVRAVCAALRDVHSANVSLHEVQAALEADGVGYHDLHVAWPSFLGWPTDINGPLASYLREMKRAGHIAASDIPAELQ